MMSIRRISTPHDLGAAVRDARTVAQLTQAQLAERAGVSREWLIGLERGQRPRAELTKILGVLAVLDLPLGVGRGTKSTSPNAPHERSRGDRAMSTAEVTRKAIERTRRPATSSSLMPQVSPALRSMLQEIVMVSGTSPAARDREAFDDDDDELAEAQSIEKPTNRADDDGDEGLPS